jgi:hypothetical protein
MTETTIKLKIGMGITECRLDSKRAGTIIEVFPSYRKARFQYDQAICISLNTITQKKEYIYESDAYGIIKIIFLSSDGIWRVLREGNIVILDHRETSPY